jgi:molecular chaperone IbpA
MDEYFHRLFSLHETTTNYPPYNLVQVSNVESRLELALAGFKKKQVNVYTQDGKLFVEGQVESRLELALAGFKKKQVNVYTQDGKLFVEGQREDGETGTEYIHRGVAQRSFTRSWTLAEDTEVRSVEFEDGLLSVVLGRIVPQHHQRKDWF